MVNKDEYIVTADENSIDEAVILVAPPYDGDTRTAMTSVCFDRRAAGQIKIQSQLCRTRTRARARLPVGAPAPRSKWNT